MTDEFEGKSFDQMYTILDNLMSYDCDGGNDISTEQQQNLAKVQSFISDTFPNSNFPEIVYKLSSEYEFLHICAEKPNANLVIRWLVGADSRVLELKDGETLSTPIFRARCDNINTFIELGANTNAKNESGNTPILEQICIYIEVIYAPISILLDDPTVRHTGYTPNYRSSEDFKSIFPIISILSRMNLELYHTNNDGYDIPMLLMCLPEDDPVRHLFWVADMVAE